MVPVILSKFPDTYSQFPDLTRREFISEGPIPRAFRDLDQLAIARNRKFPVLFPVSRDLGAETGSIATASATMFSLNFLTFRPSAIFADHRFRRSSQWLSVIIPEAEARAAEYAFKPVDGLCQSDSQANNKTLRVP